MLRQKEIKDTWKFNPGIIGKNIVMPEKAYHCVSTICSPVTPYPLCPLKPNNVFELSENSI